MSQLQNNNQLQQQLQSLTSSQWQKQVQIIEQLPQNMQIVKLICHRNYSSDFASLLASQNPRSKLVTALSEYLIGLFSTYCNRMIPFANLLVTNDCLLRLLGSGNKVVASSANQVIKCIISSTDFSEKGKQVKYVKVLQGEFLSSRSVYVREKISLYFLFIATSLYYSSKEDLRQFQIKIVKVGLQDACEKVRKNMRQILQNISQFEKQNEIATITNHSRSKQKGKIKKAISKDQGPRVIYSSLNHESILQNFICDAEIGESKVQKSSQNVQIEEISQQNFMFYLSKLHSNDTWAMIQLSFDILVTMINRQGLNLIGSDQLYCETIKKMIPFLIEKRGKMYESCCFVLCLILQEIRRESKIKVIQFVEQHCSQLIQHSAKIQSVAQRLLPLMIDLNPTLIIFKISQISTHLKTSKQKLTLMDCIIKNMNQFHQSNHTTKSNKKVSAIVRMMCQHIINSNNRDKDISYGALAVISHLKSRYPEDVLTSLLCQSDKTLTKIIGLAEGIDMSLKEAVLGYIYSLKGGRRGKVGFSNGVITLSDRIQQQLKAIQEQKVQSLNKLGELFLTNTEKLQEKDFKKLFEILQYLCSEDLIMQYRFILKQLAKTCNLNLIPPLLHIIRTQHFQQQLQYRQHHTIIFIQIMAILLNQLDIYDHERQLVSCSCCLVQLYRGSQSIKIRNKVIQGLTLIDQHILVQELKQKQLELVRVYRNKLEEESVEYF